MGTMATMFPGNILATSMAPLFTGEVDPGSEFTLLRMAQIFPGYHYPYADSFDTDQYSLSYKLYNFYADFVKNAGTFEISKKGFDNPKFSVSAIREAAADVITELNDNYVPVFSGSYVFDGEIITRNNSLATPLSWSCTTRISKDGSEEPYMNTRHQWEGIFKKDHIYYKSNSIELKKNRIEGNLTWKWGIINLVQKMSEESMKEIHFSALDEMDMVYEDQYARFRKRQKVDCGQGEVDFFVFDVLGDGILPTVYWVDNLHRVAFIVSGVEAYMIS